ncbi:MAG: hypothetical protein Q4G09_07200 [Clostridia bacterium]|nr:hypothetical protein [Clostridia bacterium]
MIIRKKSKKSDFIAGLKVSTKSPSALPSPTSKKSKKSHEDKEFGDY